MNAARRDELEASLRCELDREAQEQNLNSTGRILWLIDQIENYVERWLAMGGAAAPTAVPDELFGMIEIGAAAVSAEPKGRESSAVADSWRAFLALLAAIRAGNAPKPQEVKNKLATVRSAITASGTSSP